MGGGTLRSAWNTKGEELLMGLEGGSIETFDEVKGA